MSGKPFICAPGTPWPHRLLKWAEWYGSKAACPPSTRRYMLLRMLAEIELSPEHVAEVRRIYARAAADGKEVDHIVGLADGGLHVPWNMEILSVTEHARKTAGANHTGELLTDDPLEGQMGIFG